MRALALRLAGLVFLTLVFAACSDSTAASPDETLDQTTDGTTEERAEPDSVLDLAGPPLTVDQEALIGTSWTLLFGGGPDGELMALDDWPITITFDGEFVTGVAACNGYGARYIISGTQIQLDEIGSEDQGCAPQVQEAERVFLRALSDVNGINVIEDELALSGLASELIFRRDAPAPIEAITETLWLLEATIQDGVETPVQGEPATLRVEPGGALQAGTGCRSLVGTYVLSGARFTMTNLSATGSCPTSLFAQDSMIVSAIGDSFTAEVSNNGLTLTSVGNQGLRFRATTEDEVATLDTVDFQTDADLLEGVTWIFAGGEALSGPIAPGTGPDDLITLTITDGTYEGEVFCNGYGGDVDVGNGQWVFGTPASEGEGCGAELDAIAAAYLEALPLMTEFGFPPDRTALSTNGSDIELRFERAAG